MKSALWMLVAILLLCPVAPAQTQTLSADQLPAAVRQSFQKWAFQERFPAIKHVEWKIKSDKNYEAEFIKAGAEVTVKFDFTGKWLETETAVSRARVPAAVVEALAKRFGGYKIVETQTVQRWDERRLRYEIHLENDKEVVKTQLDPDGGVLEQSAKAKATGEKR